MREEGERQGAKRIKDGEGGRGGWKAEAIATVTSETSRVEIDKERPRFTGEANTPRVGFKG